ADARMNEGLRFVDVEGNTPDVAARDLAGEAAIRTVFDGEATEIVLPPERPLPPDRPRLAPPPPPSGAPEDKPAVGAHTSSTAGVTPRGAAGVSSQQRHTRAHPCAVCGGYDTGRRGPGDGPGLHDYGF